MKQNPIFFKPAKEMKKGDINISNENSKTQLEITVKTSS